jgi:hypothetical protein
MISFHLTDETSICLSSFSISLFSSTFVFSTFGSACLGKTDFLSCSLVGDLIFLSFPVTSFESAQLNDPSEEFSFTSLPLFNLGFDPDSY